MVRQRNFAAAMLPLPASAILSFTDNFVDTISEEVGLWQFQLFRTLMALPILFLFAFTARVGWKPILFLRWVLRSLPVSTRLLIYFAALGSLPVAQAGEVQEVIEVPVPRPRHNDQLLSPEFLATKKRLEELIHPQSDDEHDNLSMIRMADVGDHVEPLL